MYDLNFFRNNLDLVRDRLATRGFILDTEAFLELDRRRRQIVTENESLKAERNKATAEIGKLRKEGVDTTERQLAVRAMGERSSQLDEEVTKLEAEFRDVLARIPNLPQVDVPVGKSEHDNLEVRRSGTPTEFSFQPKAHWDLGPDLGILDMERAAKVTGARFAVYWGLGARLERALVNFMLDLHTKEHGYREVLPPFLINSASLYGTGQLPKFEEDLFQCKGHDLWLAPTAEVPLTNLFRDETLSADKLPISLCAYTPCFRSEAGSYGRDVRGIIRQHQFQKVELVKFTLPEQSNEEHEKLTHNAETVLQKLGLPYRTMLLCTGDMGFGSARTYDIEVWLPGQNAFKEISSCTNYEAFQAHRAQIRYSAKGVAAHRQTGEELRGASNGAPDAATTLRDSPKSGKAKTGFLHTLNGSGLAIGRTWVAIIENYQQADGGVLIPAVLQPYMGAERIDASGRFL